MSAYVIDIDTMDSIVRAICVQWGRAERSIVQFGGVAIMDAAAFDKIGRRLYTMNIDGVQQRYPDTLDNPNNTPGPCDEKGRSLAPKLPTAYRYAPGKYQPMTGKELIASYKAAECLLYQCSEGDIPNSALFQELAAFRDTMANAVVRAMPEYAAASW